MTLVFIGHSFKYELEAVCKLFCPVRSFSFLFLESPAELSEIPGDSIILTRETKGEAAELSCLCSVGGKKVFKRSREDVSGKDFEHRCEFSLCRLLFDSLKEITGITPDWGMLTGVRPVKLASRLIKDLGASGAEAVLKNKYSLSDKKIRLAMATAENQADAMKGLPENGISLYVSIPFCPSRCAYCSFVSQTVASFYKLMPEYVEKLCREIALAGKIASELDLKTDTVYFGGGTPTSLEACDLERVMKAVAEAFDLSAVREYTVEAGRPDTVTEEKLNVIKRNGGDRVSVNPQTMSDSVLKAIGRKHTAEEFLKAYELAKKQGFKAVNVDLIAGLPSDTFEGFKRSLDKIVSLSPENITVHALSIKRAADLMHETEAELSAIETSKMTAYSNETLGQSGYKPYYLYRQKNQLGNQENVGWERGGSAGIYNINMMEEVQTVLAVGAGGSTKIVSGERNIVRLYDPKYPLEYIKRFDTTVIPRKEETKRLISEILESGGRLGV